MYLWTREGLGQIPPVAPPTLPDDQRGVLASATGLLPLLLPSLPTDDQRGALVLLQAFVPPTTTATVDNALKIMKLICLFHNIPWRPCYVILEHEGGVDHFRRRHPDGVMQTTRPARNHRIPHIPRALKLVLLGLPPADATSEAALTTRLHREFPNRLAVQIATGVQELKDNLETFNGYVALAFVAYNAGTGSAFRIVTQGRGTARPSGITPDYWEDMCRLGASLLHQREGTGLGTVKVDTGWWQCDRNIPTWFDAYRVVDRQSNLTLIAYQYLRSINACIMSKSPSEPCTSAIHGARRPGSGQLRCRRTRDGALDKLYDPRKLGRDYNFAAWQQLPPIPDDHLPLKVHQGHLVKTPLMSTMAGVTPSFTKVDSWALALVRNWVFAQFLGWGSRRDDIATRLLGFTNMTPDEITFAQAVARWQLSPFAHLARLPSTGAIDSNTWAAMRPLLP